MDLLSEKMESFTNLPDFLARWQHHEDFSSLECIFLFLNFINSVLNRHLFTTAGIYFNALVLEQLSKYYRITQHNSSVNSNNQYLFARKYSSFRGIENRVCFYRILHYIEFN